MVCFCNLNRTHRRRRRKQIRPNHQSKRSENSSKKCSETTVTATVEKKLMGEKPKNNAVGPGNFTFVEKYLPVEKPKTDV